MGRLIMWVVAAAVIVAVTVAAWLAFAHPDGPSLDETLGWMDSTYNSHTAQGGSPGYGMREIFDNGAVFERKTESLRASGCRLTLVFHEDPNSQRYSIIANDQIDTLELGNIDPASAVLHLSSSVNDGNACAPQSGRRACNIAELDFETRNRMPLIASSYVTTFLKLSGNARVTRWKAKTFQSAILISDVAYAKRFLKAFQHAVKLCGGRPSTF
ncbi:MAG TPA: hypothetical protein VMU22_07600 [Rhizomicrobium sp.]|nr:hypothetical protein [Rhizomicrobium sp.]